MTEKRTATELLEGAYEIETPEDSLAYYHEFAAIYDAEFAERLGYAYPAVIAEYFAMNATPEDLPVADIGCGTGLVAEAFGLASEDIEGFDISPDMLAVSKAKSIYGALHRVDLTKPLAPPTRPFGAVVSAGTFTHGHLGPAPLWNLLELGAAGALFCIGINAQHYANKGFDAVVWEMVAQQRITHPILEEVPIFSDPNSEHGKDMAMILVFRKR